MNDLIHEFSEIIYHPIGIIRSGHTEKEQTPIQPVYSKGCKGSVEIFPEYAEGLKDLASFSHIYLLYNFHRADGVSLLVKPFIEDTPRGIFSTRHHDRPNPIGFSLVKLLKIEDSILYLEDVDILDGTPLLDIKPFIPRFDQINDASKGWTGSVDNETANIRGKRNFKGGGAE
jgi:tRNA-Thr(GGU) m(6)t(6)A37 methyltransferase TsaA